MTPPQPAAGRAAPAAAPARTLERLERLLRVVPWLLAHPGTSVDELAERFGAERQSLVADLDLLGYCGVPGYGGGDLVEVRIVDDRVTLHLADALRDPLRLTAAEALTLLLSARLAMAISDVELPAGLVRAADRLAATLNADDAVVVEVTATGSEHVGTLQRAVARRRVVRLRYRDALGALTERDVEPWALTAAGGRWYLQGHCRVTDAARDFRVDRIEGAAVTDERAGQPPSHLPPPGYRPEPDDPEVAVEVDRDAAALLDGLPGAVVEPRDAVLRATARVGSLAWAARFVLSGGGRMRPVAPPELVREVAQLATAALERADAPSADPAG